MRDRRRNRRRAGRDRRVVDIAHAPLPWTSRRRRCVLNLGTAGRGSTPGTTSLRGRCAAPILPMAMRRIRCFRTSPISNSSTASTATAMACSTRGSPPMPRAAGAPRTCSPRRGRRSTASRRCASASSRAPKDPDRTQTRDFHWVLFDCELRRQDRVSRPARGNDPAAAAGGYRYRVIETVVPSATLLWNSGLMNPHRRQRPPCGIARQRGVVLFVAMMAIVALALGGHRARPRGDDRRDDRRNIAARTHVDAAGGGCRSSMRWRRCSKRAPSPTATPTTSQHNYFASRQAGEDGRGMPRALQVIASLSGRCRGHRRSRSPSTSLCDRAAVPAAGAASVENCTLSPPSVAAARGTPGASEPPRTPALPRHRSRRRARGRRRVRAGDARRNTDAPPAVVAGPR